MNTRPIRDSEWEEFCVMDGFPSGERPQYADGILENGHRYMVAIDSSGSRLFVDGEEQSDYGGWKAEFKPLTPEAARAILSGLGEPRTLRDFLDYGFQPY